MNIFPFLMTYCFEQDTVLKQTSAPHPQTAEVQGAEQPNRTPPGRGRESYKPGGILVNFKYGIGKPTGEAIQRQLHLKTIREFSTPNLYLMKVLDGSSVQRIMESLKVTKR